MIFENWNQAVKISVEIHVGVQIFVEFWPYFKKKD